MPQNWMWTSTLAVKVNGVVMYGARPPPQKKRPRDSTIDANESSKAQKGKSNASESGNTGEVTSTAVNVVQVEQLAS